MEVKTKLEYISKRRKVLDLSQRALAKEVGTGQSMIAKIENGKTMPSYELAEEIFDTLNRLEHKDEKKVGEIMHTRVVALDIKDTVGKADELAKKNGFSQFPVLDGQRVVGSIKTSDLIDVPKDVEIGLKMGTQFPTVDESTPISQVNDIVKGQQAVLVMKSGKLVGIVTAEDLL